MISIHALLAESDRVLECTRNAHVDFYPRSPCGERPQLKPPIKSHTKISIHALLAESDIDKIPYQCQINQFLSTLSLRRATATVGPLMCNLYFYPRSPCGERPEEVSGDTWQRDFYPRSPCGERRCSSKSWLTSSVISIHALLAESDVLNT